MSEQKKEYKFSNAVYKSLANISKVILLGFRFIPYGKPQFWFWLVMGFGLASGIAKHNFDLRFFKFVFPSLMPPFLYLKFSNIPYKWHFAILSTIYAFLVLFYFGVVNHFKRKKIQDALDEFVNKNSNKYQCKLKDIEQITPYRQKYSVKSTGYVLDDFTKVSSYLGSVMGTNIEDIRHPENTNQLIEIFTTIKKIPSLVYYNEYKNLLKAPGMFLVGKTATGIITQNIIELPHGLIAGEPGSGKTIFFTQWMLGLNESTNHCQFYLIDLKKGGDYAYFCNLPNVKLIYEEGNALQILKAIREEMEARFEFMKVHKINKIDPETHKMDRIVIAVDEASILYGKSHPDKTLKTILEQARIETDMIVKLGRAAGIHLILATQKIDNETIDSRIRENIVFKVFYRTNNIHSSIMLTGSNVLFKLPHLQGRAYVSYGSNQYEIQTPFVSPENINSIIHSLKSEFENGNKQLFSSMIDPLKKSNIVLKESHDVAQIEEGVNPNV